MAINVPLIYNSEFWKKFFKIIGNVAWIAFLLFFVFAAVYFFINKETIDGWILVGILLAQAYEMIRKKTLFPI